MAHKYKPKYEVILEEEPVYEAGSIISKIKNVDDIPKNYDKTEKYQSYYK